METKLSSTRRTPKLLPNKERKKKSKIAIDLLTILAGYGSLQRYRQSIPALKLHLFKTIIELKNEITTSLNQGSILSPQREQLISNSINLFVNNISSRLLIGSYGKALNYALKNSFYILDRLITTEIYQSYNQAKLLSFSPEKVVKVNTILDRRTCPACEDMSGREYTISTAPTLPLHPLCRCYFY